MRRSFHSVLVVRSRAAKMIDARSKVTPLVALVGVALLWATYGPILRYLYTGPGEICVHCTWQPSAVPDQTLFGARRNILPYASHSCTEVSQNAARNLCPASQVARCVCNSANTFAGAPDPTVLAALKSMITATALATAARSWHMRKMSLPTTQHADHEQVSQPLDSTDGSTQTSSSLAMLLKRKTDNLTLASAELGLLGAAGAFMHTWGLSQLPATTAGFLVQATSVITPCLAFVSGEHVSRRTWTAVGIAALGTVMVSCDGLIDSMSVGGLTAGSTLGKAAMLSAAACYSLATFRLSQLSPGTLNPLTSVHRLSVGSLRRVPS
jgi:hypothetical protein